MVPRKKLYVRQTKTFSRENKNKWEGVGARDEIVSKIIAWLMAVLIRRPTTGFNSLIVLLNLNDFSWWYYLKLLQLLNLLKSPQSSNNHPTWQLLCAVFISNVLHYDSKNITHETYSRTALRRGEKQNKWNKKRFENKANVLLKKPSIKNYVNAIETINLISPSRMMRFSCFNHAQTRHQQDGMR